MAVAGREKRRHEKVCDVDESEMLSSENKCGEEGKKVRNFFYSDPRLLIKAD